MVRFRYSKLTKEAARAQGTHPPGLRMTTVAELTPIIQELRRKIVEERWYGSRVVSWLKRKGVSPGFLFAGRVDLAADQRLSSRSDSLRSAPAVADHLSPDLQDRETQARQ